jgi:23S rRNA (guanosine2251-2'-O)-methyltransferase
VINVNNKIKESDKFVDNNIFEGLVSIKAIISARENGSNDRGINTVLFDEAKLKAREREYNYLQKKARIHGFTVELCDSRDIDGMTIGSTHGGIIALCDNRSYTNLATADDIQRKGFYERKGFYAMVDGIEDPYNFGYCLRSLYAAGVSGVILPPRNWLSAAGVVCRASAGASEFMNLYISDCADAVDYFRQIGYKTVATGIKDSVSLYETTLPYPIFLIIGGEKRGISKAVSEKTDLIVRLDYGRDFSTVNGHTASLSAASAASIIAFEIFRQNLPKSH